jgi:hypothetical protein
MSVDSSALSPSSAAALPASPTRDGGVIRLTTPGIIEHPAIGRVPKSYVAANRIPKWLGAMFALTILVSAFLLFQVQPLISKFILPWFGGSPAVWTTCMLFFQLTLFGGYAYAHLLTHWFSHRGQGIVHLSMIALALALALPTIAPATSWKPLDPSHPTGRILWLLAATVGVPYFLLSTTGPLVQAWFARTWPGRSPYRLYALSNAGSLAALVTFPFVFEPAFASDTQAGMWTAAFGLFAALCGACAVWIFRLPQTESDAADSTTFESKASSSITSAVSAKDTLSDGPRLTQISHRPSAGRRLLWVLLPACASLMLLATTNYVCQDVAVIPFLWVVPLSLYLLTFIICFDHPRWYRPVEMSVLATGLLILSAGAADDLFDLLHLPMTYIHELALYFGTMFFACLVCHGQLVRLRPAPRFLTEYYMLISAGGALGGVFVGLIAPHIFRTHFEWTLALGACLLVAGAVLIGSILRWGSVVPGRKFGKWLSFAAVAVVLLGSVHWLVDSASGSSEAIYRARNFYGTVSVLESDRDNPEMHHRTFVSGTTRHGRQFVAPEKRRIPISYFAEHTGIGQTLKFFQNQPGARFGVVGMGVGVVATYAKPGQYVRFYEINDQVNDIAHNYFTFLSDCECPYDVVLSDARLALERELAADQPQHFDVLALDAFTGDAPPVHLLTDEAFAIYLQHLNPDGVIVVNITNRYINLAPVINAVAKKYGLGVTRVMTDYEPEKLLYRTDFMMLTRNQKFLAAVPPVLLPEYLQPDYEVPLWTDKFSNLFSILKK